MNSAAIRVDKLSVSYGAAPAIREVTGVFEPGSLTAIAGPNGAGKSTLLKALMGEIATTGSVDLGVVQAPDIGYLPQASAIDRSFPITVADAVCLGAWKHIGVFGGLSMKGTAVMRQALQDVGLAGMESRPISDLSVGQFQRVLFARLLVQDARVIVLDEPFTAVDSRTIHDLTQLILRWKQDGRTVIAVLHDFDQIRSTFPQTLLLSHRVVAWGSTEDVLTESNLSKARALAECWDVSTDQERRVA
ncbi:metal ABC transporter ATP-binding protein [Pseudomonas sp. S60]|uniref:metal ABC transporter ATP-binding protein n=1 Tax=unclassified Pseudomonas TaxID=196821 RepID=UPI0019136431|nr:MULTISPECIES: metal ABC transporter ATP-binding protein [unclassified Pseudomonas]MBK5003804.1 metal ABC transporter ATP-binding protein [Pseudomonas sp. S32]MBK5009462.1 metal ABC transporter ATP-binding protein [Pseudomonas sp. S60]